MVYQWKVKGLFNINAEEAGHELERISKESGLTPQAVVDESRAEDAVLHSCFEWDDEKAGEQWRRQQARVMLCQLTVVDESVHKTEPVRLFVNLQKREEYQPIHLVISDDEMRDRLVETALKELIEFKHKYKVLCNLEPFKGIFERIAE